jgi:hypothetical protein
MWVDGSVESKKTFRKLVVNLLKVFISIQINLVFQIGITNLDVILTSQVGDARHRSNSKTILCEELAQYLASL